MTDKNAKPERASRPSKPHRPAAKPEAKADGNTSRLIDQRIRDLGDGAGKSGGGSPPHPRGGPGHRGGVQMDQAHEPNGRARVVPRWDRLHGRDLQTGEADLRRGASLEDPAGSSTPASKATRVGPSTSGREKARRGGVQGTREGRGGSESRREAGQARSKLLSGGNPQIAKADGDAPVQAYIAAMPGWKRDLGKRLDALIVRNVPNVRKAVKWNSPFYGIEGQGWFLSFHVFTHYVKVTFFRGTSLRPSRPAAQEQGRALDRHPRRRRARRGADGDVGEAGRRVARLGSLGVWHVGIRHEQYLEIGMIS